MKTIRLPVRSTSSQSRINSLKDVAARLLSKFCTDAVISYGLSTKNFNFTFDFKSSPSIAKRSTSRLMSLFYSDLKKALPYVTHADHAFMKPTSTSDTIHIDLGEQHAIVELKNVKGISFTDLDNIPRSALDKHRKVLQRYCRMMNRRAMAASVPLVLVPQFDNLRLKASKEGKLTTRVVLTYTVTIQVIMCSEVALVGNDLRFTTFSSTSIRTWMEEPFASVGGQLIFTAVPQIRQVLRTLTRKAKYDSFAFIVGTLETP